MQMTTTHGYRDTMLSRFKFFGPSRHFHKTIYRNKGVRKDAERFSLVDPVLDGEYNDPETRQLLQLATAKKKQESGKKPGETRKSKLQISRVVFQALLFTWFCAYYVFHLKYRP
jgi:hypothetical protein